MLESLLLGMIQGVVEWLPVSSEGAIVLARELIGAPGDTLADTVRLALFLHLGTFFAALAYFRKDVREILHTVFAYRQSTPSEQARTRFLLASFLVSGLLGAGVLSALESFEAVIVAGGAGIILLVGAMLLVTGALQLIAKKEGVREAESLTWKDTVALGIGQGLAAVPGISRSGMTVSLFLLRGFTKETALTLSFLMSLPIVLAGNIVLNFNMFALSLESLVGLIASFLFGLVTIKGLLLLARTINFGWFAILFGTLTLATLFLA